MKKKLAAIALAVVMVAMLFTGLTIAYFTDTEEATNVFTIGDIDITLTEPKWKPEGDGGNNDNVLENIVPNVFYAKNPTVENTGTNPVWVRIVVEFPGYNKVEGSNVLPKDFLDGKNEEKFKVITDDTTDTYKVIFESKNMLQPTGKLVAFDGIKLPATVDEAYLKNAYSKNKDAFSVSVVVTAQAIQSEGFKTAKEAFDALTAELS